MNSSRSVQACAVELITYSSQGCPDDENKNNDMITCQDFVMNVDMLFQYLELSGEKQ
jgi:hypothetical protein